MSTVKLYTYQVKVSSGAYIYVEAACAEDALSIVSGWGYTPLTVIQL